MMIWHRQNETISQPIRQEWDFPLSLASSVLLKVLRLLEELFVDVVAIHWRN